MRKPLIKQLLEITAEFKIPSQKIKFYQEKVETRLAQDRMAKREGITKIEGLIERILKLPDDIERPQLLKKSGYINWALDRYAKGGLESVSDLDHFWKTIELFRQNLQQIDPAWRDINRFKTLQDLDDKLTQSISQEDGEPASGNKEERGRSIYFQRLKKDLKPNTYKEIYNDGDVLVLSPKTFYAANLISMGATWCTGGGRGASSETFNSYNQDGPLYIIISKKESEKRVYTDRDGNETNLLMPKRWQVSLANDEYQDASNRTFSLEEFVQKLPVIKKIFKFSPLFNPKMSESDAIAYLKSKDRYTKMEPSSIRYLSKVTDKIIETALKASSKKVDSAIEIINSLGDRLRDKKLQWAVVKANPRFSIIVWQHAKEDTDREVMEWACKEQEKPRWAGSHEGGPERVRNVSEKFCQIFEEIMLEDLKSGNDKNF